MRIDIVNLGRIEYGKALSLQERLQDMRIKGETADTFLLVEHPPVLTLGRRGKYDNLLVSRNELKDRGIDIFEVARGGDITYHGPGQIVGYPILDLNNHGRDIKDFVWKLEDIFIELLGKEYGISAQRDENKYTGVWVGNNKITAIGISVKRWVTMHGFAFNVNTCLDHFKWINPCGLTDRGVTSLEKLTGSVQDFDALNSQVIEYFCKIYGLQPNILSKQKLYEKIGVPV